MLQTFSRSENGENGGRIDLWSEVFRMSHPDVVISENDKNKCFIRIIKNNKHLLQPIPEH